VVRERPCSRRTSESGQTRPKRSVGGRADGGKSRTSTKAIKHDFLAKTSSKHDRLRSFYVVFAVALYNIWGPTDFQLKAGVDSETDHAPVLTAGQCVEIGASALIPPD
jgi:hypothetical protein